ncbi:MAG: hypothetical protein DWQ09_16530 [Proteobacteria bacterium]|nr:MAG: hypothetical protein DWQ09_16530 [Pseudomonadota bacterium]QKK12298.1 MAG: hypothetical protein HND59_12615 [Pseudomonadota bacterium]
MSNEQVIDIEEFPAPFSKQIKVQEAIYDNGFHLLRVRIRERSRFTMVDLDAETARHWGQLMVDWADRQPTGE